MAEKQETFKLGDDVFFQPGIESVRALPPEDEKPDPNARLQRVLRLGDDIQSP